MCAGSEANEKTHDQPGNLKTDLERMYIEEYLHGKGYQWRDLCDLPGEEAKQLMCDACTYASLKLAEVESRAHFQDVIHYTQHS